MMNRRTRYLIALIVAAAFAAVGCASVTPTTVSTQSPVPEGPEGAQYLSYVVAKYMELGPGKWRTAGYFVDMPGFPLPMFSDPGNKDVTTAHLTFCTDGKFEDGMSQFVVTHYYDETPDGDFANLDSLCGGEEGVRALGGDSAGPHEPQPNHARTVVDRSVVLEGPEGTQTVHPSPQGTEWYVTWEEDPRTGLIEAWVFALSGTEPGMESGTN